MAGQQLWHHGDNYLTKVFHLKLIVLHMLNIWLFHGMKHTLYMYENHHVVESIVNSVQKELLMFYLDYYASMEKRDYTLT